LIFIIAVYTGSAESVAWVGVLSRVH